MSFDLFSCMRSFVAIAECNGFAAAARKLHLSPPVLTKQIQWLEHHVRKSLLERTTRQVRLTEAGQVYVQKVRKILQEVEQADAVLHELETEPHGRLVLGFGGYLNIPTFVRQLKQFADQYPKIMLDVRAEVDPALVLAGALDLAVGHVYTQDQSLIHEHLFDARRRLYATPGYLKARGVPKTLADLQHHDCLLFQTSSPTGEWVFGKNKKIKVAEHYTSNASSHFQMALCEGFGIAWSMDYLVAEQVAAGVLQEITLDIELPVLPVLVSYRPQTHNLALKRMIEHLHQVAQTISSTPTRKGANDKSTF